MKDLDIILPVYNEKNTLEIILKEWSITLKKTDLTYSFIICEDGSTDGTKEVLSSLKKKYPIILNQKKNRRGYGNAVTDGIFSSKAQFILCVDSDGQCDPNDFLSFWRQRNTNYILIGWRTKRSDSTIRLLYSFLFRRIFYLLFPNNLHDHSSPYVLFKKKKILPIKKYLGLLQEGFWWGFVGACIKQKIDLREIPIHHRKRFFGNTQVYMFNKMPSLALRNIYGLIKLRVSL